MATVEIYTRRHPLRQSSRRLLAPAKTMVPEPMEIQNLGQPITRESRCDSRRTFGSNLANCISKGSLARPAKKQKEVSPPCTQRDKKASRRMLDSLQLEPEKPQPKQFPSEALVYETSITQYIQHCENLSVGIRDYMQYQTEIDSNMRGILVNWLVDVHQKFKLCPQTLFMAVNLVDRYLNEQSIPRSKLQLVGITSLLIASKYQQIYVPDIKRFVDVCDSAYKTPDLLQMQGRILLKLNFNLTFSSSLSQMEHKIRLLELTMEVQTYCSFILQLCLMEYRMCQYKPGLMAMVAIYLSNKLLNTGRIGSAEMMQRFGLDERVFKCCLKEMFETYKKKGTTELQAVKRKFARLGVL